MSVYCSVYVTYTDTLYPLIFVISCSVCRNLSNNANGHFTLATLPLNLGRRGFKYPQYLRKKITIILTIIWIQIIFPYAGGLRAKVVYKTNSGNVLVRIPRDEKTKQNWHAAAHSNKSFRAVPRCSKFCHSARKVNAFCKQAWKRKCLPLL